MVPGHGQFRPGGDLAAPGAERSSRCDLSLRQRRGHGPRRPQRLHLHRPDGTLRIDRDHLSSDPAAIVKEPLGAKDVHLEKSPGHHRDWLDCIRSRNRPLANVEIGARSVAITILGNLAYWNGRHLRWDPARWEFVDDPEANRWLDRERRDPWQLPAV